MEELELNSKLKIEEFFENKENYEKKKKKMKKSKSKHPLKCILCNKKGGTNFYIKDNEYIIECDSFESNCKNTKQVIERIRKILINDYLNILNKRLHDLNYNKNQLEFKNKYFDESIEENELYKINEDINSTNQKITILNQYVQDKKQKKEEQIKSLNEQITNDREELKTELSYLQPDYEKILKIQEEIQEKDNHIHKLRYSHRDLYFPLIYSNKDSEFGECEYDNNYYLYLQDECLNEMEEYYNDDL